LKHNGTQNSKQTAFLDATMSGVVFLDLSIDVHVTFVKRPQSGSDARMYSTSILQALRFYSSTTFYIKRSTESIGQRAKQQGPRGARED